jgi:uncharacterized membrane protein
MANTGPLLGPVQLMVITLDNDKLAGQISRELHRASDKGAIRLLDALAIQKTQSGGVVTLSGTDLTPDQRYMYGALIGALMGFGATSSEEGAVMGAELGAAKFASQTFGLSGKDIQNMAADIPPGKTGLIVLFEHLWALPLKDAVQKAGGVVMVQGIVRPEDLLALGSTLAMAETTAEMIEQAY